MLIAKCYAVVLHLKDGRTVRPARGAALMHDPSGNGWPKTSCLIAPFAHTGKPMSDPTDEMESWAMRPESVKLGEVTVPPRTGGWREVGRVTSIDYTRHGEHADQFTHEFKRPVRLLQRGRILRLELGRGAEFNWRGFVNP